MNRLLIVSNRLPLTIKTEEGDDGRAKRIELVGSSGGLATGLRGPHQRSNGLWIGWPGDASGLSEAQRAEVDVKLAEAKAAGVHLTPDELKRYYNGFSNGVLWPLFHYQLDRIPADAQDWDAYRAVNERFAAKVLECYRPGDDIWVHDYHLMLVPSILRRRLPDARIGFFLHIPFPPSDIFRTLPWRSEILEGLLGADLIGFHAFAYARHFSTSVLHVLGRESTGEGVMVDGRNVRFGVFPMGIDASSFQSLAGEAEVVAEAESIRSEARDQQVLLGIDRLDYTKGIPHRLAAFERLLEREPSLRGRVRLVQLAVPSREDVDAYAETRTRLDEIVGRVNGRFGTASWTPIHYLYRALTPRHVVALYRAADVMLVTPLRDGMNLVAKEFVASRVDEDGVLVLSEFAGAATELGDALLVNPFHTDGLADAMSAALRMPRDERRTRMRALRRRVLTHDVDRWAASFIEALAPAATSAGAGTITPLVPAPKQGIAQLMLRLAAATHGGKGLVLLLDYEGALVSTARARQAAAPDRDLLDLLARLAALPSMTVHVVSGRSRQTLEAWLGALPISLHAEHGLWSREQPGSAWTAHEAFPDELKRRISAILAEFTARTPGSSVEEKSSSLAWNYRLADPDFGMAQARELRVHLANAFSNAPIEALFGDKVVEVRAQGAQKDFFASSLPPSSGACVLAMGNDAADEEIFDALPQTALTIHVGEEEATRARYRLSNPTQARAVLHSLLAS